MNAPSWLPGASRFWPSFAILVLAFFVVGLSAVNQDDYAHEGKRCRHHLDCRVKSTGMICASYEQHPDRTKWACGCQAWIREGGERVVPYYNEDVDHCVLREGQLCSLFSSSNVAQHNTIGNLNRLPTYEDFECEPGATCESDDKVKDHGRCVRSGASAGPRACALPAAGQLWLWLITAAIIITLRTC